MGVGAGGQLVPEVPGEEHVQWYIVQDPAGGFKKGGEHHQVLKLCIYSKHIQYKPFCFVFNTIYLFSKVIKVLAVIIFDAHCTLV